jgi:hypothetical protein
MKKILALLVVLGMATAANATVIDCVTVGLGSAGHAGTSGDPLDIGETIPIQLVLNDNDWMTNNGYPQYAAYDGYILSLMEFNMTVSSQGEVMQKGGMGGTPQWHSSFGTAGFVGFDVSGDNYIDKISGVSSLTGVISGAGGPTPLLWNLKVEAISGGRIDVDLALNYGDQGQSKNQYENITEASATFLNDTYDPDPYPGWGWIDMVPADVGSLDIYVIPEPMTVVLLGLGGLGLIYRRRRA